MIVYFIAYISGKKHGNVEVELEKKIESIDDIRLVEKSIREDIRKERVVILNWKELSNFVGKKNKEK